MMRNGRLGKIQEIIHICTVQAILIFPEFFQDHEPAGVGQGFGDLFYFFASIKYLLIVSPLFLSVHAE